MQLLPLIYQNHALGIDQSEAVDPPQADVQTGLGVGRLVHRGGVAKGVRLVQGTGWGWFKRYQVLEVIDVRQRLWSRVRINLG